MALVAMLAFSTVADAQFGSFLKDAKSAVSGDGGAKKNEKIFDELVEKTKAFVPQKGKTPNATFTFDGKTVAMWNGSTNELTITTDLNGNTPGTVLKVDNSGVITDISGNAKGLLSETTIESPNFGLLRLDAVIDNIPFAVTPKQVVLKKLMGYIILVTETNEKIAYGLPITVEQKEGKGYNFFVEGDPVNKFDFAGHVCTASNIEIGALLPIYVASLMVPFESHNKDLIKKQLGYDPDKTYTTAELEDLIRWQDDDTEAAILKLEKGWSYNNDKIRGCKVAKVGLRTSWQSTTHTENIGKWNEHKYTWRNIQYWVIYELKDGTNKVAFYQLNENYHDNGETSRGFCEGFHEVTDWVRSE